MKDKGMNSLSYYVWVYSKEDTHRTYGPVVLSFGLVLCNTEVLLGELLLYNRFLHINEIAIKVRWPSPWTGDSSVWDWLWEHCEPCEY